MNETPPARRVFRIVLIFADAALIEEPDIAIEELCYVYLQACGREDVDLMEELIARGEFCERGDISDRAGIDHTGDVRLHNRKKRLELQYFIDQAGKRIVKGRILIAVPHSFLCAPLHERRVGMRF